MDKQSQELLDQILKKSPENLSDTDKAFLRARESYLTKAQREDYEEVLNEKPAKTKKESKAKEEDPIDDDAPAEETQTSEEDSETVNQDAKPQKSN